MPLKHFDWPYPRATWCVSTACSVTRQRRNPRGLWGNDGMRVYGGRRKTAAGKDPWRLSSSLPKGKAFWLMDAMMFWGEASTSLLNLFEKKTSNLKGTHIVVPAACRMENLMHLRCAIWRSCKRVHGTFYHHNNNNNNSFFVENPIPKTVRPNAPDEGAQYCGWKCDTTSVTPEDVFFAHDSWYNKLGSTLTQDSPVANKALAWDSLQKNWMSSWWRLHLEWGIVPNK